MRVAFALLQRLGRMVLLLALVAGGTNTLMRFATGYCRSAKFATAVPACSIRLLKETPKRSDVARSAADISEAVRIFITWLDV